MFYYAIALLLRRWSSSSFSAPVHLSVSHENMISIGKKMTVTTASVTVITPGVMTTSTTKSQRKESVAKVAIIMNTFVSVI
jgi:hypothetical protein